MTRLGFGMIAPAAIAVVATACSGMGGLGGLGDIFGGGVGGGADIVAEVQYVDTQQREIEVVTDDGQRGAVRYDDRTTVYYRGDQYPVEALERGDIIAMRLQEISGGYYVQTIEVQQSVQERGGVGSAQRFDGYVGGIDRGRGLFELRDAGGREWIVALPNNPDPQDLYTFERLRSGDRVEFEGQVVGQSRIELYRFL
ncbi:MAG: hypothetical protein ACRELV_09250 [Longimicrobiales bacterium]